MMQDVLHRKSGLKVMYELPKCGLVEQKECIVLRDNELDHMVDKASHREWGHAQLARNHPI